MALGMNSVQQREGCLFGLGLQSLPKDRCVCKKPGSFLAVGSCSYTSDEPNPPCDTLCKFGLSLRQPLRAASRKGELACQWPAEGHLQHARVGSKAQSWKHCPCKRDALYMRHYSQEVKNAKKYP